jgi:hypothetical protein
MESNGPGIDRKSLWPGLGKNRLSFLTFLDLLESSKETAFVVAVYTKWPVA